MVGIPNFTLNLNFGGAIVSTTTFDPSNKGTGVTLSGGNLTATVSNISNDSYGTARSIASHSSGKFYVELIVNNASLGNFSLGLCNSSLTLDAGPSANYPGVEAAGNSLVHYLNSTNWQTKNGNIGTAAPAFTTNGDRFDIAVDLTNGLIWDRLNGGSWNSNGAADPATGSGGVSISTMAPGPYFLFTGLYQFIATLAQVTANFGASPYVGTPPAGFGNW